MEQNFVSKRYNYLRMSVAVIMALFMVIGIPLGASAAKSDSAGPASDRGVQPVWYFDNPSVNGTNAAYFNPAYTEYRIDDLDGKGSGTYSYDDGYLKIKITVDNNQQKGPSFDWEIVDGSTIQVIPGIFVKGGNGGNWYNYTTFEDLSGYVGADWDGYLHSPLGAANGKKFYGLSHISFAYKIPPDAYITIKADDTNEIGDPHTFTVTVWEDSTSDGNVGNFVRAAGETVTVTFQSLYGADTITTSTGTTDSNGEYTVTVNSQNAGQIVATASADVEVDDHTISVITDGSTSPNGGQNSEPATKTYVDAYIKIATDDTNRVGVAHDFTVTVWEDPGTGFVLASGETVTVTFQSMYGAETIATMTGTTDSNGEYTATVNSQYTGQIVATASSYVSVGGLSLYRETDGVSPNSGPATKTYVNARISIAEDDDNAVGNKHVFTILLERDLGNGNGFVAFSGQTVSASISGVGDFVGSNTQTTDTNGYATVSINSADPGLSTVTASFAGNIVSGYANSYISISTDGTSDNSDPAVKTWWVGRITLTPLTDTNEIGDKHQITAHVEYSKDGSSWMDVSGALVSFSLTDTDAYFVDSISTGTTGADGTTSVWINKPTAGTVTISAKSNFTVSGIGGTFNVATGTGYSGSDVKKTYVDAYITIAADDTNLVGVSHTFTVTVWENPGTGFVRAAGETVVVTFTSMYGADTVLSNTGTTDSNGEYTVTINSQNTGQITAKAASSVSVGGLSLYRETDGVSPNSGPATKTYVDARISIAEDDANAVDNEHVFTILLEADFGDGNGFVGFSGQTVTASLSGVGYFVGSKTPTTDANGKATVTINSDDPGTSTVTASFKGNIVSGYDDTYISISTDGTGDNSDPAVKTWWVGRITLTPAKDINPINDPHKVTAHVEYSKDGSTWMDVSGALVTFSLSDGDAYFVNNVNTGTTGADGTTYVYINKETSGIVTISAESSFTVSGIGGTFKVATGSGYSGDNVIKTYVDAHIMIKADDTNLVGVSHTFTVTVWENPGTGLVRAAGETVTVTFKSSYGADTINSSTGTTDTNGEYKVTINSQNTGQIEASASSTVSIGGLSLYRETDGVSPNSGPATKTYVDARISIGNDDVNAVGNPHTFTIMLEADFGDGNGFVGFSGQTVTASLSGVGYFVGSKTPTTDANGKATVTINSDDPGTSTVTASFKGNIVSGYDGSYISIATDGTGDNTDPAVKTWWVGRIILTPLKDTNEINDPHKITAHVEYSKDGTNWIDASGVLVTFKLTDSDAYFVSGNTGTTGADGTTSVDINKPTAGIVTISASSSFTISGIGGTFKVATGVGSYSGSDVKKTYVDAYITITPDDTNLVGVSHTFTVTVWEDPGTGFVKAAGETVTVSFSSMYGADAQTTATGTTNSDGEFTVTINSQNTGQIVATASSTVSVGGLSLYRETDGVSPNSGPATKTYVDARISIGDDDDNVVGNRHTFTILLEADFGDGNGFVAFSGQKVTATLSGVGAFVGDAFDTTDSNGEATVTINSKMPGTSTVTANFAGNIVSGYSDTYIEISTDGTDDNSEPAVKTWWVGKITLTPLKDTNEVNDPHTITAHVEYSKDGTNWIDASGVLVSFKLTDSDAYFVSGNTGTTGTDGTTSVDINKPTAGIVTISAGSSFTISGIDGTFNVATGVGTYSGSDVKKTYVDAYITITPDDTNLVNVGHTFTVTVWEDPGTGFVRAAGETVTVSFNSMYGADAHTTATGTTDSNGEFTVSVNSQNTGKIVATASSSVSVGGLTLYRETDGISPNSGPATKTYVDARIIIAEDDDNVIGNPHTFTITLERDLGDGNGFVAFSGQKVTATLSGMGVFVGDAFDTTDSNGEGTVTINSNLPGKSTVSASFMGNIVSSYDDTYISITTDGTSDNSEPAVKTWWVGRITLTPATDTNGIGEDHEIVATVEYSNDGTTWTAVPDGTLVTFSLYNNVPNAYFVDGDNDDTTVGGKASAFINADDTGTVDIGASSSFAVSGIGGTFSVSTGTGYSGSDVEKTYVSTSLFWLKHDQDDYPLAGATFEVTRTHDRFGNDITDEIITVLDNSTPDADPDAGEFLLEDLKFGTYTIKETKAPEFYSLDDHVETVSITDLSTSYLKVSYIWINYEGETLLTPTGYDIEDFWNDTAPDLVLESSENNKVTPGAFFYYSMFKASGDTTIKITTSTDPAKYKNPKAFVPKLYIIDKTTGNPVHASNFDGVKISIKNNVVTIFVPEEIVEMSKDNILITKVSYKPTDVPSGTKYLFATYVNDVKTLTAEITIVSA